MLYKYLPGLTDLKLVGAEGRLQDMYGPGQPSFKVTTGITSAKTFFTNCFFGML
jgi:hypothetical protein